MGYTTLEAINADMADEAMRIGAGNDPNSEYTMIICPPAGIALDPRRGNELRPVLNNLRIVCLENAECLLDGSQIQVLIENSQVDNYPLTKILVQDFIFQGFVGTAIAFRANTPTEFTCENCIFQGFTNTRQILEITSPTPTGDPAGTVRINNGIVRVRDRCDTLISL